MYKTLIDALKTEKETIDPDEDKIKSAVISHAPKLLLNPNTKGTNSLTHLITIPPNVTTEYTVNFLNAYNLTIGDLQIVDLPFDANTSMQSTVLQPILPKPEPNSLIMNALINSKTANLISQLATSVSGGMLNLAQTIISTNAANDTSATLNELQEFLSTITTLTSSLKTSLARILTQANALQLAKLSLAPLTPIKAHSPALISSSLSSLPQYLASSSCTAEKYESQKENFMAMKEGGDTFLPVNHTTTELTPNAAKLSQLATVSKSAFGKSFVDCPICRRSFSKRSKLREHLCRHTGERPFMCHHCSSGFVRNSDLRRHLFQKHNVQEIKWCQKQIKKRKVLQMTSNMPMN